MILRVTAQMQSPIVARDEIHLDSVLLAAHPDARGRNVTRSHHPHEIRYPRLPIARLTCAGAWVYVCSGWQMPAVARGGLERFCRRKDADDVHRRASAWTPSSGADKNYSLPVPTIETPHVSWLCVGDRRGVIELLRYVEQLGSLRRQGFGRVLKWSVDAAGDTDPGACLSAGGVAARHLPASWSEHAAVVDRGPVIPPYWHPGLAVPRVRAGVRCALLGSVASEVAALC